MGLEGLCGGFLRSDHLIIILRHDMPFSLSVEGTGLFSRDYMAYAITTH